MNMLSKSSNETAVENLANIGERTNVMGSIKFKLPKIQKFVWVMVCKFQKGLLLNGLLLDT